MIGVGAHGGHGASHLFFRPLGTLGSVFLEFSSYQMGFWRCVCFLENQLRITVRDSDTSVFYSTWNLLSLSEKISIYVREKSKLSVKQHQKYPWKNRRACESFEKILYVKITFQYVKIYKNYLRENLKVAVKNHGKIFKSTFFGRVFIYFDLFPAVIKKLFAWKQNLWKISILCPWKLKLIRENF